MLGAKRSTQNDFVNGELGMVDLKTLRICSGDQILVQDIDL